LPVSNLLGLAVKRIALSLHDQTIELRDAAGVGDDLEILFGAVKADIAESGESESGESGSRVSKPRPVVGIAREPGGGFTLEPADGSAETGLDRDDLLNLLQEQVVHALIVDMASAVVLHAGAVSANGRVMLLAGPTGSGKTSLAAWFVANGFRYLSDEVVALVEGGTDVVGFPRAMVVKGEAAEEIGHAVPAHYRLVFEPVGKPGIPRRQRRHRQIAIEMADDDAHVDREQQGQEGSDDRDPSSAL
jgi:hypothetical protein